MKLTAYNKPNKTVERNTNKYIDFYHRLHRREREREREREKEGEGYLIISLIRDDLLTVLGSQSWL